MKFITTISFILFCLSLSPASFGQPDFKHKNKVLQNAHDKKIKKHEFVKTDQHHFKVNIYTVDEKAVTGKTHHWFFKLADEKEAPLNYAKIKLSGYWKADPSVKFNYMNPVFPLCSEGKYIIGFVKVKQSGTWVLEATINNFGKEDTITYEIEINDPELN